MKVNIAGRGVIPGLNRLSPVRGVDLSKAEVARIINYRQFKVYSAETGFLINHGNIDKIFEVKPVSKPVVKPVIKEPVKTEIIQAPITKEEIKPKFLNITEIKPVEEVKPEVTININQEPIKEEEIFETPVVEETIEEKIVENSTEETIEEVKEDTEEKKDRPYQKKKNKYKKH